jgi:protocatechuate 3,4-dioxygenase beta subunit
MGADTISAAVARHDDGDDRRGVPMIDTPTRRVVLGAGVFAAGSLLMADGSVAQAPLVPTPACHDGDDATAPQTEGPYFKPSSPERTELFEEGMAGQPIELVGFVLSRGCKPLAGALLDFWQADDKGGYDNSGFRLRGHQFSDAEGRYRLRSIVPGIYPGRTRHIHVKVQPQGGRVLTTQLYFPGESKNRSDSLFRKDLQIRTAKNAGWLAGRFDFVVG